MAARYVVSQLSRADEDAVERKIIRQERHLPLFIPEKRKGNPVESGKGRCLGKKIGQQ